MRNYKPKMCEMCNKEFIPRTTKQRFCGSKTKKIGCSWINAKKSSIKWHREKMKDSEYRKYFRKLQNKWKKKQRELDTPYAQRVRESKREKAKTKKTKDTIKKWKKDNPDKVREYNRKRILMNRDVEGSHTIEEWETLKYESNYQCVECKITEDELKVKWIGTNFTKLTRDHIIPLVKDGTDYIDNIQPMCISCNASKKDFLVVVG